jgi:hypothetical protein
MLSRLRELLRFRQKVLCNYFKGSLSEAGHAQFQSLYDIEFRIHEKKWLEKKPPFLKAQTAGNIKPGDVCGAY